MGGEKKQLGLCEGGRKLSRAVRLRRRASTVCSCDRHIVNLKRYTELKLDCMANQNHNLYRIRNHNHYHNHSVLMFYKLLRLLKYILQLKTSHSQFRERNWGPMILFVIQNCILKIYFNRDWFTNDDDDDSRYWTLTESRLRILRQHMYSKLEVQWYYLSS